MTRSDRFKRQDYTSVAKAIEAKDLEKKEKIREIVHGVLFLLFLFAAFAAGGTLTYPY